MAMVKTSGKGQVVIPKEVRDGLGISAGSRVLIRLVGDHAEPTALPRDPVAALRGCLKRGSSMARELLEERAKDERHRAEGRT